jgi:hypothetical protein
MLNMDVKEKPEGLSQHDDQAEQGSIPGRGEEGICLSLYHHIQTISGAHPTSQPAGNGGSSCWSKAAWE